MNLLPDVRPTIHFAPRAYGSASPTLSQFISQRPSLRRSPWSPCGHLLTTPSNGYESAKTNTAKMAWSVVGMSETIFHSWSCLLRRERCEAGVSPAEQNYCECAVVGQANASSAVLNLTPLLMSCQVGMVQTILKDANMNIGGLYMALPFGRTGKRIVNTPQHLRNLQSNVWKVRYLAVTPT
jgi:hypothetical protein